MNQKKQDALLGILFFVTAYIDQTDKSIEERCEFRCITEK